MNILGYEIGVKRVQPKVEPVQQNDFVRLGNSMTPVKPVRRSRGQYDKLVFPLIDESNPWEVMALRTYQQSMEKHFCGSADWFSICVVDKLVEQLKIPSTPASCRAYQMLRRCHCTDYALMPQVIFDALPHLANYIVSGGTVTHPSIFVIEEPTVLTL